MTADPARRLAAEALGTGLLVATVVGSGIMADALSADDGVALLGNTIATGAILVVLITILGPVSGAHLNPAVTLVFALRAGDRRGAGRRICAGAGGGRAAGELAGARDVRASDHRDRHEGPQRDRAVACRSRRHLRPDRHHPLRPPVRPDAVPWLVGLYITAAYWFTASTSFANPAVAVARGFSDTFAGIRPLDVPAFVLAELAGAAAGLMLTRWLLSTTAEQAEP